MPDPPGKTIRTQCCVVGGGPAGMMLGYLLARAGVRAVVLEKHADFLRDFRGDTVHPSTLQLMEELGLLEDFLRLPHSEVQRLTGYVGGTPIQVADFSHLPTKCKFVAFMPQWDFLNFLADRARHFPTFQLLMRAEVTDLIEDGGRVLGVRANTADGPLEVLAGLVVGCDGRHSTVRARAGFDVEDLGAPMDVLWLRFSRRAADPTQILGRFDRGKIFIMLDRGDYWQCGYVIPKGGFDELKARGLDAFRAEILGIAPELHDRVGEVRSWDDVRLLTVAVDRLRTWYRDGLLCIGDAAHAMSPIGGVGINLAVQDAVATANILAAPLRAGKLATADLASVQRRRMFPTRMTQRMQVTIQNRIIRRALAGRRAMKPGFLLRLMRWFPVLRRIPARLIGMGFRPEHIRTHENQFNSKSEPEA
jgi:2-polyprenyl-6-methoxyphenol hydroxylase-like FAD-dependent oxidoreductase